MRPSFSEVSSESAGVYAAMDSPTLSIPPYVMLSYQGLEPPLELFASLTELGWVVPPQSTAPSVLDEGWQPVAVEAYRVDDVVLREGRWDEQTRRRIGPATFNILRAHGVHVSAPETYERLLFPAQIDAGDTIDLRSPSDPLPHSIIIENLESSIAGSCSYRVHRADGQGFSGQVTWSERARQVGASEVQTQRQIAEQALLAWNVDLAAMPEATPPGKASLRLAVEDARRSGDLVQRLRDVMGDRLATGALRPMVGSTATTHQGLLIIGAVEKDRLERIRSLLIEQNPFVLARLGPV